MREVKDAKGRALRIRSVSGVNAFAGMIEGTPFLSRKWRVLTGRRWMEAGAGRLVHGLSEIELELEAPDARKQDWPARERWTAVLVGADGCSHTTELLLELHWYQEGGDPMARLQEIVSAIDFAAHAAVRQVDNSFYD